MKSVDQLASDLRNIISKECRLKLESAGIGWKEKWEDMLYFVGSLNDEAQDLYDDAKENGLSSSMIESEGYLRALKTINNRIVEIANREED